MFRICFVRARLLVMVGGAFADGNFFDLDNLRYALSYCLWGNVPVKNPNVVNTPCITTYVLNGAA